MTPPETTAPPSAPELTVFFDGSCPRCRAEIGVYRGCAGAEQIAFVDVAAIGRGPIAPGLDQARAIARFHVMRSDGTMASGAAGFARLWLALPGWRWLGRLVMMPFVCLWQGWPTGSSYRSGRRCNAFGVGATPIRLARRDVPITRVPRTELMPRKPATKNKRRSIRNLLLVLGDQLSINLASLAAADRRQDLVLMCEVAEEATYVRHHKKKLILLFSAMRHFAIELKALGWRVAYTRLDDAENAGNFSGEVARAVMQHNPERIIVTEPGEWRVMEVMRGWQAKFNVPVDILTDTRFISSIDQFTVWAKGRKQLRMEYFYRDMRRKTGLLMDGDEPTGGQWNFDHDNRKPAKADLFMPQPARLQQDHITRAVVALVQEWFAGHFGDAEPFWFAVTRAGAEAAFEHFLEVGLAKFGDYQDAMVLGERFLYHSLVSIYLNCGLLDPLTVCRKVDTAYRAGRVPLNAAEGYIRQIIGWREYVRGIYWLKMPDYAASNVLGHTRALPEFYWTGVTKMACMREAITQTKEEAYAHHIQRLMVTGTFGLLAGVSPQELHEWYLAVYADAYEWVELPNTIGMSQFADGGLLASKPYAASGAYINRMSNYCSNCVYDVKVRTGPKGCPFNALYWDFISRHAAILRSNPRMTQMVRTYDKFDDGEKALIKDSAARFLESLS